MEKRHSGEGMAERVLRISARAWHDGCRLAERAYPEEACGLLIGRWGSCQVEELVPVVNADSAAARSRFAVHPWEYRRIERAAERRGRLVLGCLHSHPDHPAIPSSADEHYAQGWPEWSWIIVSVGSKGADEVRSWRWSLEGGGFLEERLERSLPRSPETPGRR